MPEGHSIHRLARAFLDGFGGQRLRVTSPQGRFAAGAALLDGGRLVATDAWGKNLFLGVEPEPAPLPRGSASSGEAHWLHVHLGLYGAWTLAGDDAFAGPHAIGAPRVRVAEEERPLLGADPVEPPETAASAARAGQSTSAQSTSGEAPDGEREPMADRSPSPSGTFVPPPPRGQVRVRIVGQHGVADLTGPTRCEVITTPEKVAVEAALGPDPLRPDPDGAGRERFVAAVRRSRTVVGAQLMDQSVLAGVGNIYRAELLYRARLHPLRPGTGIAARTLRALWDDAVVLMADGAATGRIVTTEPADRVVPEDAWYVYHRDGRPCLRCGRRVMVDDLATRRVYWCPGCQRRR